MIAKERREWDSNPCGPEDPRALKARALTTLPSRLRLSNCCSCLFLFSVSGQTTNLRKVIRYVILLRIAVNSNPAVTINSDLLDSIFEGARRLYPREVFLLLRGRKCKDEIRVMDLVVPPFAVYGRGFTNLPFHMLPTDFSILGTVHSHPSGNLNPSTIDLNHFFGRILMIVGFPFVNLQNTAVYNSKGEKLTLQVT